MGCGPARDLLPIFRGSGTAGPVRAEIIDAVTARINDLSTENLRYVTLQSIATAKLASAVAAVRNANAKLAGSVEPLVAEKMAVMESVHAYGAKLTTEGRIACPACGQQAGNGRGATAT